MERCPRLVQVKREDIFITTKIPGPIGGAAVQKMVLNETLPNLGVDYVHQSNYLRPDQTKTSDH